MGKANAQSKERPRRQLSPETPKLGMTRKGCVLVGPPRKGVSNGSVGSWLTGERALMGDGN